MEDYATIINGIVNGMIGVGTSLLNNSMASTREAEARRQNNVYNELAARNADARTRKLYADLQSPAAMLSQIKAAGLSPSLMFGGGAQGAQPSQGAQGAGATGINPTTYGMNALDIAQLDYMRAMTRKTEAEAENEEGTGAIGSAKIRDMLTHAGLNEALTSYNNAATLYKNLETYVLDNTKDFDIYKAQSMASKASYEAQKTLYDVLRSELAVEFDKATLDARINTINLQNENIKFDTLLKRSDIAVDLAKVNLMNTEAIKWQHEVIQGYADLLIKEKNANTQEEFMKNINDFWDAQAENLEKRLDFDKSKLIKEMRYKYVALINTFVDQSLDRGSELIMDIIPFTGTKTKVTGL